MSACFTLVQEKAAYMITDAAVYYPDGTLTQVNATKASTLVSFPAVISCTGASIFHRYLVELIEAQFDSFDDVIQNGCEWIAEQFREIAERDLDGDATCTLWIIGWHKALDKPAAYALNLWTDGPQRKQWLERSASMPGFDPAKEHMRFDESSGNITGMPFGDVASLKATGFQTKHRDDYTADVDLVHIIEFARHQSIGGVRAVGGRAVLSKIDASGISQRVVHEWPEDRIGDRINAKAPDWQAFRRMLERRSASKSDVFIAPQITGIVPIALNRKQRLALAATQRKAGR